MSFVSPFANVLGTNYVPTPVDIGAIERTLEGPCAELQALEYQLLQLQEQLETKRETRDNLSRSIDEHRNLLTPFRCLPDDILSEIFMACLPTMHEAIMDPSEPPLILGYVCRRWRSVAYHTPRLWATLHIAIPAPPNFNGYVDPETVAEFNRVYEQRTWHHQIRISTWLSRSKTCPLSISINHSYSRSMPPETLAKSYYELIYTFANRIRRLDLDINQKSTSDLATTVSPTSFPHLRVLLIKFHRRLRHRGAEQWKNSGLLNVPKLTCLSLSQCPLRFEEMNINCSHLTHIIANGSTMRRLNTLDAQMIFTRCPRLQFCTIDISSSLNTYAPCIPISLPYLHTLSIVDGSTGLGDLFQYADIPSLRHLTYHSKLCPPLNRYSSLHIILSRTNMKLEHLTTNIQFFTLADLIECFEMIPSLTHFTNIHCNTGYSSPQRRYRYSLPVAPKMLSALLYLLTPEHDRPLYLPNLRVVHFNLKGLCMQVADWELSHFIRRRMDRASQTSEVQVAALTEIHFVSTEVSEIDIRAELADYVATGLKLHLTYPGVPSPPSMVRLNYVPYHGIQTREVNDGDYL